MRLLYPTRLLLISISTVLLYSCSPTKFYSYDIQLNKPTPSKNLHFENDTVAISFTFHQKYIELELYNKLDDGLKINWDEISISINEQTNRVFHYAPRSNEIFISPMPITVPPRSKVADALVTKNKVNYAYNDGRRYATYIQDSYPKCDFGNKKVRKRVQQLKGQRISIYLPFYLKNTYHEKTFEFTVADIKERT